MKLVPVVKRQPCPDLMHVIETVTVGMAVTVRVIRDYGMYERTLEIFTVSKSQHNWLKLIAEFERLAMLKYKPGITPYEYVRNLHKSGN